MANNLRKLRKIKGMTLDEVAKMAGTSNQMLGMLERGERQLTQRWMERLAPALGVLPHELMSRHGSDSVPIVGYVGAGSEAHYYETADSPGEYAAMPVNASPSVVAVKIRGMSLGPALDGWLAYYNDIRTPPTHDLMRKLCVVALEDDRVLVKLLYPGSAAGLFNLHSNTNEPIIENVAVKWAALVVDLAMSRNGKVDHE